MIDLTNNLILGSGNHKVVYAHPTDKALCVKILRTPDDDDFAKEMRYRKALGERAGYMTLLTKYYGEVETSLGKGYLFERVIDFDGASSQTMLNVLDDTVADRRQLSDTEQLLLEFKRIFFAEKFLLAGVDADNYLVQRISPSERHVRIIDNIGTSARLPLAYYFEFAAQRRLKKYWRIFAEQMRLGYGEIFSEEFLGKLADI